MLCLGIFRTCFTWKVSLSPPLCRLRCCFFNPPGLGSLAPNLRLSKSEGIDGIAGGELIWIQLSPDKIWRNTKTSWQEDSKDVDEHLVLWVSFSLAHFHAYDWNWLDLSKLYWIYFFVCALAFVCKQLTVLLPQICPLLFVWLGKETLQAVGLSKTEGEIFVSSAFMCFLGID